MSSSSRPAAHENMSVDRSLCCRCRARSVSGVRTARGRCGACTRSARAPCCAPSHTISYCTELGSGGGGWPSQTAWRKRFLGRSDINRETALMAPTARTRRVALSRPILTMLHSVSWSRAPDSPFLYKAILQCTCTAVLASMYVASLPGTCMYYILVHVLRYRYYPDVYS